MTPIRKDERVDPRPLAQAFERSGLSAGEVARRLGWMRGPSAHPRGLWRPGTRGPAASALRRVGLRGPSPDSTRVLRALGLRAQCGKGGGPRSYISLDSALRLAGAIGVDPPDIGL